MFWCWSRDAGSDRHCLSDIKNLERKQINIVGFSSCRLLFVMKYVNKEIRTTVEDDEKIRGNTQVSHNTAFVICHLAVRVLHTNSHY